jgi:hypothetical protein
MRFFQQSTALFLCWCLVLIGVKSGVADEVAIPINRFNQEGQRLLLGRQSM